MSAAPAPNIPAIAGLGEIAGRYDAILCDVWGVLHNGRESFPPACEALAAFRAGGGAVALLTNAPRPHAPIEQQIMRLGVPREAFDVVVTSGDVTISLIADRILEPTFHIGPARDVLLFEAAAAYAGANVRLVDLGEASYVVCTGLFDDETEGPGDYDPTLAEIVRRGLTFICANPDLVVQRGDKRVYCAGAIAERFRVLGGEPIYCGKPHAPIYRAAFAAAELALGRALDPRRVLAIGDGMLTDIAGAVAQGLDALFISAGIHLDDVHGEESGEETQALAALFAREGAWPVATLKTLRP